MCSDPKTNEQLLERTRENAAEMAVREQVQRMFGSYSIDGARGLISRNGVFINYRVLAQAAVQAADLFDASGVA